MCRKRRRSNDILEDDESSILIASENPTTGKSDHESAQFTKTVPTTVLWAAIERLFEGRIAAFTA